MSRTELLTSLDFLKQGGFKPGPQMDQAHQICQSHEGSPLYDWIHALVHRIEGDDANAAYWYRRAGQTRHAGSVEEEWQVIRTAVEAS
ncbi:hypothetical protein [Hoeflea prorocentri]|uniref:Uncharacterized protein n=1 Tax=Hoeflea prorocentri TaxID=1922333 RepID=A0A9X3ZJ17_9HYPH|nr:hypothetical protein [Hoeflea prorocentri]MCY6382573.1 hypothetical protein [Hoeflea prorocentri]MDA5400373.1 hypothetical protein [Hoeflea prorocentri]